MSKKSLLMGASALIGASMALTGGAQAQTQVYGGGSTLIAPYLQQVADCYGAQQLSLINQGSFDTVTGTYDGLNGTGATTNSTLTPFDYLGAVPFNCHTQHVDTTVQFNTIGSGSGNGQLGIFTHDIYTDVGATSPAFPAGQFNYGTGDYGIGAADVAGYNLGTVGNETGNTLSQTTGASGPVVLDSGTSGTYGCATGSGAAASCTYANPALQYGAFIQVPISVDPVALGYSSIYKEYTNATGGVSYYKFHVKKVNADGSGGLALDMPTVCAIFNGAITNWNDPALKALNGNTSLMDPSDHDGSAYWATVGLPIEMVGRSDSSGTTSIFYRALAAQCTGTYSEGTYTNQYGAGGSHKLPSSLQGPVYTKGQPNNGPSDTVVPVSGKFTLSTGSSGIAAYLDFNYTPPAGTEATQGRLGYIGTDYVLPAVINTGANVFGLDVADVKPVNTNTGVVGTKALEPTAATAVLAFGTGTKAILPPQSTTAGVYTATPAANSHGFRTSPQDWVEPISTTISYSDGTTGATPLSNPDTYLALTTAYPIVGTTQMFLNTCFASSTVEGYMDAFMKYYETNKLVTDTKKGDLALSGLAPLPTAWLTAVNATFFTPTATKGKVLGTAPLKLFIAKAGAGSANADCVSVPGA